MTSVRLFVYGSLKRGARHHAELEGCRFLREVCTARGFAVVQQGERQREGESEYLALVRVPEAASTVRGELFEVAEAFLPALDEFEGEGYERGEVILEGEIGSALAYFKKSS